MNLISGKIIYSGVTALDEVEFILGEKIVTGNNINI
jgi:hypothetical protein